MQRLNLEAFGFKFPGFPSSVGPFGLTATQATGSWNLLEPASIDSYRASGETVKAAEFNYRDARDTVVLAVGANYLLIIAQESRVEAAQAELKTAKRSTSWRETRKPPAWRPTSTPCAPAFSCRPSRRP